MTKIETISNSCIEEKSSDLFDFFFNTFAV